MLMEERRDEKDEEKGQSVAMEMLRLNLRGV